ncbi:hypothetical protein [Streptomyces sp. NRRL F-5126]|uniref:hypothetical protein n=1 Tax=Streptomyces sp. NRRL F-5126 TaxID=1463857 RepID=UPI0004CA189B|nr:hypothetical protein [Streptomyces sp. NRRL F-5126]
MSSAPDPEREPAAVETGPPTPVPPSPRPSAHPGLVFDDPLDQRSADDTDDGWGERPAVKPGSAADLARFLDEKPPHHI